MDRVVLIVSYGNGIIIKIPFKNLKDLDEFTINFNNIFDLGITLIRILNLDVSENAILGGTISYLKKDTKSGKLIEIDKPIKYNIDDYELNSLKDTYCKFFIDDRNRIKNKDFGLCNVEHSTIKNFVLGKTISITDLDIQKAVNAYFTEGYLKYRDAYFNLKKEGYIIPRIKVQEKNNVKNNLNSFDTENEYFAYLQNYANIGEEKYAKAMDILSGYDSDEIRHDMINGQYGVFDGTIQNSIYEDTDKYRYIALALEKLSGHSLQELIDMNDFYGNKKGYMKR